MNCKFNHKRSWLRKFVYGLSGAGLAGCLAWSGWHASAQDAAMLPPAKTYLNRTTIHLPIVIDERHRSELQSVQLYVKEGPSMPWRLHEKAPPTQTSFTFKAPGEGEYWFNIVSVDNVGRSIPEDVNKVPPAQIVVLDTQAPVVELQPLPCATEGQYVRCRTSDVHLDSYKTRFYYQTGDQVWRALDSMPGKGDTFCVPAQAAWTGNVRVIAVDLAGNATTREMSINSAAAQAPGLPSANAPLVPPPNVPPPNVLPSAVAQQPMLPIVPGAPAANDAQQVRAPRVPAPTDLVVPPMPATNTPPSNVLQAQSAPMPTRARESVEVLPPPVVPPLATSTSAVETASTLPPRVNPEKTVTVQKIAPPPPQLFDPALAGKSPPLTTSTDVKAASLTSREAPAHRHFVNGTRINLDYKIESLGASGIGKVEIWYTRDLGQSWQKLGEDTDRQSPAEVNLPGEGVYGVSLIISNGRGFGATPPNPGDTPDYWVEVDTSKPLAELVQVRPGTGDDSGALYIAWNARDKNLNHEATELHFAASRQGPWQPIAKGLKNEGVYRWMPPMDAGAQAFLRLTVRDLAGNVSMAETTEPVQLDDMSRPRARVLGVTTASAPRMP